MNGRKDGRTQGRDLPFFRSSIPPPRRGFTLIELLLVVVISLIAALIAVASFEGSFQSAQLRTACKVVVTSHKYARSMAVLDQKQMMLLVDTKARNLEVDSLAGLMADADRSKFLDSRATRAEEELLQDKKPAEKTEEPSGPPPIQSDFVRDFPKDVKIESFKSMREGQDQEGVYWTMYYPNGMSDGFTMTLVDKHGKRAMVSIDAISGGVKVEYEQ